MNGLTLFCTVAGVMIVLCGFVSWLLSVIRDDKKTASEMDEAKRRADGMLLQDKAQEASLLAKSKAMRERMGDECCLHPEYKFQPKHRQVVGRE